MWTRTPGYSRTPLPQRERQGIPPSGTLGFWGQGQWARFSAPRTGCRQSDSKNNKLFTYKNEPRLYISTTSMKYSKVQAIGRQGINTYYIYIFHIIHFIIHFSLCALCTTVSMETFICVIWPLNMWEISASKSWMIKDRMKSQEMSSTVLIRHLD